MINHELVTNCDEGHTREHSNDSKHLVTTFELRTDNEHLRHLHEKEIEAVVCNIWIHSSYLRIEWKLSHDGT